MTAITKINNPLCYDLHCHSFYSDGQFSPAEVVKRAATAGVGVLALTDHDTLAGVCEAKDSALGYGITLIAGVEISTGWRECDIHIIGLQVNDACQTFNDNLSQQLKRRVSRAKQIANQLQQIGIKGAYEGAIALAGSEILARPHFAKFLINQGHARDFSQAFKQYLAKGNSAYVPVNWPSIEEAVAWIKEAGGQAVLAHPKRYGLKNKALRELVKVFKTAGGEGIEVISANATIGEIDHLSTLAVQYDLLASQGSDFHGPGVSIAPMGKLLPMPSNLTPIWHNW